jgi:hypothetical protein
MGRAYTFAPVSLLLFKPLITNEDDGSVVVAP